MSLKLSTGLRNQMLATGSLRSILNGMMIRAYSGTPPASADDAVSGAINTLLVTYSLNAGGTGLTFEVTPVDGSLVKTAAETWSGVANGTVDVLQGQLSFWRMVPSADNQALYSETDLRMQGTFGLVSGEDDIVVPTLNIIGGTTYAIDTMAVTMPSGE